MRPLLLLAIHWRTSSIRILNTYIQRPFLFGQFLLETLDWLPVCATAWISATLNATVGKTVVILTGIFTKHWSDSGSRAIEGASRGCIETLIYPRFSDSGVLTRAKVTAQTRQLESDVLRKKDLEQVTSPRYDLQE